MNKYLGLKLCLLILSTIFLSSCLVVFNEPIFDAKEVKVDKRLIGKWLNSDPNEKQVLIEFNAVSDSEIDVVATEKDGQPTVIFKALSGKIGDKDYLNLVPTKDNKGIWIVRYEVQNDEMSLWMLDPKKIGEAVQQKQLKGISKTSDEAVITDNAKNVKAFLKARRSDEIFKLIAKLKRIE